MLYVDCTSTIVRSDGTGIQRVVRKVLGELLAAGSQGIRPVIAAGGIFYPLNAKGIAALLLAKPADAGAVGGTVQKWIKRILALSTPLYLWAQTRSVDASARSARLEYAEAEPCDMTSTDRLLLLDSFWGGPSTVKAAQRARRQGAAVIGYLHDLIPLTHPEVMPAWQHVATKQAVSDIAAIASGIITTSEHCSATVREFLADRHSALPIVHNYHGSDFALSAENSAGASGLARQLKSEKRRIYVMVGTLEPRKGHDTVLSAFERLWADGSNNALVFVGKIGWVRPSFIERIRSHPEQQKRLFFLEGIDDAHLSDILRGADAAIVASVVEGFGLPVVEALAANLTLLASDIPVFREIAGDHALFFRPNDPASLAEVIGSLDAAPDQERPVFSWPTWRESALSLVAKTEAIANPRC
jgi:O-antigen biosynthesis alpha-1,2-rhamnosyltransferase